MVVHLMTPPPEFAAERHCQSLGSGMNKTCSKNVLVTNRGNAIREKMERELKRATVTLETVSSMTTQKNKSSANQDQPNGFDLRGGNESQIKLHLPNPGTNADSKPMYDITSQQSELLKKLKGEAEEQERSDAVKTVFEVDGPANDKVCDDSSVHHHLVKAKEDREAQEKIVMVKSAFEVTASRVGPCSKCAGKEKHLLQKVMEDVEAQRKIASMKSQFEGNGTACLVSTNTNSAFVNGLKLLTAMQEKIDKNAKAKVKIVWSMAMDAVEVLREIDVTKVVDWDIHGIGNENNTTTNRKPKIDANNTEMHDNSTTTGSDLGDSDAPAILRNQAMGDDQDGGVDHPNPSFTTWKLPLMSPGEERKLWEEANNLAAKVGETKEVAADLLQQVSEQVASTDCSLKSWGLLLLMFPEDPEEEEKQHEEDEAVKTAEWYDEQSQETGPNILHQASSTSSELLLVEKEPNLLLHQSSSKSSELLLVVYPWEEEATWEEAARSAFSCGGTTKETATTLVRQVTEKVASTKCSMQPSLKTTKRQQQKHPKNTTTSDATLFDETREAVNALMERVSAMVNDMFVVEKPLIGSKTHITHKKYRRSHREAVPFWYDYKRWLFPEGGS